MTRSFKAFVGITSIALALVSSSQVSCYAQAATRAKAGALAKLGNTDKVTVATTQKPAHRLAVQVNVNDPATMNLALNNVSNAAQYYSELGQKVSIEVVAYGPGLHMLREDTSPVKARIKSMSETMPAVTFSACANTRDNMKKTEAKDIVLVSQAKVTKSGVVRLLELQEQGWSYLRP